MPLERNNLLGFNQYMKSGKTPYVIYSDIESLIWKINGCANNSENFSSAKIGEHILCGYLISKIRGFDQMENKHTLYCGKDCMKNFCTSLRQQIKNMIDFEKTKMLPLAKEKLKSHQDIKSMLHLWKKISKNVF